MSSNDHYNAIASGYDELYGEEQKEKLQEFLTKIQLDDRIMFLDVGCGTGWTANELDVHWLGVEPAGALIAQAPVHIQAKIKRAKGEDLPFGDASFDIVLSLTALQNYDDPEKGIQELFRVCKPGGKLLLSFLKQSAKKEFLDACINKHTITDSWESTKDMMYICEKRI
ncbi:MAG: class I SAM-dependent methyltransferase [Candidatus Woesearchaeota archaeon]|nr:class I SAM-dependent methyltransferase [Candidatus Woesearchaeota archaeon]